MDTKERILQFLDYKAISPTKAESMLSWGKGALIKAKSISVDKAGEFLLLFNDLSAEWLMRGVGEMLRPPINETKISPINVDGELINIEMEKEIKRLRASIDALIEKNERLEAELIKYREKESLSKELAG